VRVQCILSSQPYCGNGSHRIRDQRTPKRYLAVDWALKRKPVPEQKGEEGDAETPDRCS